MKIGDRFNRLTVLGAAFIGKTSSWNCICDCGSTLVVKAYALTNGMVKSCGCLKIDQCLTGNSRRTHGLRKSETYKSWQKMKERCHNPKSNRFHRYGGRGITVCDEWVTSFENFLADMGIRPEGTTLGRANNDLPYCKSNCFWATDEEQSNNKSTSRILEYKGVSKSATLWGKEYGLSYSIVASRLRRGWSIEKTLTTPLKDHVALSHV